ncbi:MAG: hypothetical protein IT480_08245 [Gammaproteobacteria bacterium]|nr:hypothetical protein [Gammaproteobacteria bacterium]
MITERMSAGCFALYAGLVFVACTAIVMAPVIHRNIHHRHVGEPLCGNGDRLIATALI